MTKVPKAMIGQSGKLFVQSLFLREGIPCREGENSTELIINLTRPNREFSIMTTANLQPKRAGGKGKMALDWWIPKDCEADFICCADLSTLRTWLFRKEEIPSLAQQMTSEKYHLYMYTTRKVALRGKKEMKFDYEFESFKLENRIYRKIFKKKKKIKDGAEK